MNRGSSLVYRISHLNKFSRLNVLNKAQRQLRVLVWWLHVTRETFTLHENREVTCSNWQTQCSAQETGGGGARRSLEKKVSGRKAAGVTIELVVETLANLKT